MDNRQPVYIKLPGANQLIKEDAGFFTEYSSNYSLENHIPLMPEENDDAYFKEYLSAIAPEPFPIPFEELKSITTETLAENPGAPDEPQYKSNAFPYLHFKAMIRKYKFKCLNEQIFVYAEQEGRYIKLSDSKFKSVIREGWDEQIQMKLTKNNVAEIIERLKTEPTIQIEDNYFNCYPNLMNFRNGVLNLKTGEFKNHSPKYRFTSCIQADYYRNPPGGRTFDNFLKTSLQTDPGKEAMLQEIVGYMFSEFCSAKKAPMIIGQPHSGKSTLNRVISELIGKDQVANVQLHRLHERFVLSHLSTKKVNICSEISDEALSNIEIFKAITGNDELVAEYKGKDHFTYRSKIKLLFSGNSMPVLKNRDAASAFFDRIIVVNLNYSVPEKDRDHLLESKLLRDDRSYIVSWAVEGIMRLMQNNFIFSETTESLDYKRAHLIEQNHVSDFIKSYCCFSPEYKIHQIDLYEAYLTYCNANCFIPRYRTALFSELSDLVVVRKKFRLNGSKPLWGFEGVTLIDLINKE